jgi:hypothetical protein
MVDDNLIQYRFAEEWYRRICSFFNFDQSKDCEARDYLFNLRQDFNPNILFDTLTQHLHQKQPLFFGAGPNLVSQLDEIYNILLNRRENFFLIAADGAALALKEKNIDPDLIVTDLDGLNQRELLRFSDNRVILLIHGHGDNIKKLEEMELALKTVENIICTTQVAAKFPIINPGGFTDGDRGIFFCHHLTPQSKTFLLLGYELKGAIGKYSKPELKEAIPLNDRKREKLQYCKKLLNSISERHKRQILFFSQKSLSFFN